MVDAGEPHQDLVRAWRHARQPARGLLARPDLHPATGALGDEEGEHRAEGVRRPGDREPRALHHPLEPWPRVAAVVPGADIVVGPGPLVGGHGQQHPAPGCEHPRQLRDGQGVVLAVLDHVEGRDHVERLVGERQRLGRAAHSLARHEAVREQVERHAGMVPAHPADARGVGTAHVQRPPRLAQEGTEDDVQEIGAGTEPPVVRLAQRRGPRLGGVLDGRCHPARPAGLPARRSGTTPRRGRGPPRPGCCRTAAAGAGR